MKIIVKRGFVYEKIFHKAGEEVSGELAKMFPEHVKAIVTPEVAEAKSEEKEELVEAEEHVVEEVKPAEKPKKKSILKRK